MIDSRLQLDLRGELAQRARVMAHSRWWRLLPLGLVPVLALLLALQAPARAALPHQDGETDPVGASAQRFASLTEVGPPIQLTTDLGEDAVGSIMQASDGTLWMAWTSDRSGNYDVWYKTSTDGGYTWTTAAPITTDPEEDYSSDIMQTSDGTIWVVWHSFRSGSTYDLWYTTWDTGAGAWATPSLLPTDGDWNFYPTLGELSDGTLWLMWYSFRSNDPEVPANYNIYYKTSTDGGANWSSDVQLTTYPGWDYVPSFTETIDPVTSASTIWVTWTSDRAGNDDIWYKTSTDGGSSWSTEEPATTDTAYDYYPSIAVDQAGTLWLAFTSDRLDYGEVYYTTWDPNLGWLPESRWTQWLGPDWWSALCPLSDGHMAVAWGSERSGNDDMYYGIFGVLEDAHPPPYIYWINHSPSPYTDSDDVVTFTARAADEDPGMMGQVFLLWELNGVPQGETEMYDDGLHGDGAADDETYGLQMGPFSTGDHVVYTARATDTENSYTHPEPKEFTVIEAYAQTADILLVSDGGPMNSDAVRAYYTASLNRLGYSYDVWDTEERGKVYGNTLDLYLGGLLVWAAPNWSGYFGDADVQAAIADYLDDGGLLFISGQDVAERLGTVALMTDYFHAEHDPPHQSQDVDLWDLQGTVGDPIGDGLMLTIAGGDGANNQSSSDEVDPISPAQTVFTYYDGGTVAQSLVPRPEPRPTESATPGAGDHRSHGMVPIPKPNPSEPAILEGVKSSGTAGLRVDMGTYRVVFLSFGFEAIDNAPDRDTVLGRSLDWLFGYQRGRIIVEKQTLPDGAPGAFTFSGRASGTIGDGGQILAAGLVAGTYDVSELEPADWAVADITCSDADSTWLPGQPTARYQVAAGETVTCTFTNEGPGQLEVCKLLDYDNSSTWNFNLTDSGGSPAGSAEGLGHTDCHLWPTLLPDDYTVEEVAGGACAVQVDCGPNGSGSGSSITLNIGVGEAAQCTFTNRVCSRYDVNCSLQIDVADIMAVVDCWNCAVGEACWSPGESGDGCGVLDFDDSGEVDIIDVMEVSTRWGLQGGQGSLPPDPNYCDVP